MHPKSYRKEKGLTLRDLAELIGASNASVVSKHERGMMFPSPETIERYRKATGGAVTYADWLSIRQRAKRAAARTTPPKTNTERTVINGTGQP